jgi:hypothetical protein
MLAHLRRTAPARGPTLGYAPVLPAGTAFALGVVAVFACGNGNGNDEDDNQFRDDVIWCEEAAAHLEQCCPGFDPRQVHCRFYYSHKEGCSSTTTTLTKPAFSIEESKCVHHTSCEALVESGACVRAADAGAPRTTTTTVESGSTSSSGSSPDNRSTRTEPPRRDPICP